MSAAAAARRRAAKRDPFRAAQLAPAHFIPPVVCATCSDPRLIHSAKGPCLTVGCQCPAYVEEA